MEIIGTTLLLLPVAGVITGMSLLLASEFLPWSQRQPTWVLAFILGGSSVVVAFGAWFVREHRKSRFYPYAEIVFGAVLAAQGAQQKEGLSLAAAVAFVGGVRIAIDGFKRFFEFKAYLLFRPKERLYDARRTRVRYAWRRFKRFSREHAPY
jgi:hypothetical protein